MSLQKPRRESGRTRHRVPIVMETARADLWPEERVFEPLLGLVDLEIGWHHIVVAGEHHGRAVLRSILGLPSVRGRYVVTR